MSSTATLAPPPTAGNALLTVRNPDLEMSVRPPAAVTGTRFARAGVVDHCRGGGRSWFGAWRPAGFTGGAHDDVTGTAGEFGMGYAGTPLPPGFAECRPGDTFVKIGIGVLRRLDAAPYSFRGEYQIVAEPDWELAGGSRWLELRQELRHPHFGYRYTYRLELPPAGLGFVTAHALTNLGCRPLHQTHYSHNFFTFDDLPAGPDWEARFAFAPRLRADKFQRFAVQGQCLGFSALLPADGAGFAELEGFGNAAGDNQVTLRHRAAGVGYRLVGDRPVVAFNFFATRRSLCPEPFVELRAAPGETCTWQHRYELFPGH